MKYSRHFRVDACSAKLLRTYSLFCYLFGVAALSSAQTTAPINQTGTNLYSDTLNCNGTPTFSVNLSGQPGGVWISNPQKRDGDCCSPAGDNNCVQFTVLLDPASEGIIFSVPGGCGASPTGALFYQVDCGPLTSVGTPLCLNGTGPFIITFCKPGNNENCYSISSIPAPYTGGDVITADGCKDTLTAQGLEPASISWTSISPGITGQYNTYLNNLTNSQPGISGVPYIGQSTVIVTPQTGYPSIVYFQVCGQSLGGCSTSTFCDTVSVTIYPNLFVSAGLDVALCNGSVVGTVVTGTATSGTAPFTYTWTGPNGFVQTITTNATTCPISVPFPGVYTLSLSDITGCPAATDQVNVVPFTSDIFANAGPDQQICAFPTPTLAFTGSVTQTNTGMWSGGTGNYSGNITDLTVQYTPSNAEINAGFFTLILNPTNTLGCPYLVDSVTVTLTQFTGVLVGVSTNVSCTGSNNGSIAVSVAGGASIASYEWSNGALTENVFNLPPGNYTLVVTDMNGCSSTFTEVITEPPALVVSATMVNATCFGAANGSINLTATGGSGALYYIWSPGSWTTEDLSGLAPGTYAVVVTDENGCQDTTSAVLSAPPILSSATLVTSNYNGHDISCPGSSDGAIEATILGGVPPFTISWTNASSTIIGSSTALFGLPQGHYFLVAEDANGCQISDSIDLIDPIPMSLNVAVSSSYNGADVSCFSASDGTIELQVTGGTPSFNYVWLNDLGLQVSILEDPVNLSAGIYNVTIQDINGCLIDTTVTVTQPTNLSGHAIVTSDYNGADVSCFESTDGSVNVAATGGILPYSYSWTSSSGLLLGVNQTLDNIGAGLYFVTITDVNGCATTISVSVSQPELLSSTAVVVTDYFGQGVSCVGEFDGSALVTPMGGIPEYTFTWNSLPVQGTALANGLGEGLYIVIVTDANGCQTANTVQLSANPLPQFVLPPPISVCANANFSLVANIPFGGTCSWYFTNGQVVNDCGPVTMSFSEVGCVGVELKVVSLQSCVNSISADNFICISPNPTAGFTANTLNLSSANSGIQFTNTSVGAISFEWTFGDNSMLSYQENPFHIYTEFSDFETSTYMVILNAYSSNGCVDTAILWINIDPVLIFYVPNAFTPDDDQYNELFKPVFSSGFSAKNYNFSIYNRWGELIFETDQIDQGWDGFYQNNRCQDDVYTWKIRLMSATSGSRKEYVGHVTLLK